jgi:hypothetical protein
MPGPDCYCLAVYFCPIKARLRCIKGATSDHLFNAINDLWRSDPCLARLQVIGEDPDMTDLTKQPWDAFTRDTQPGDRISANFTCGELTRSETADRRRIDNSFRSVKQLRSAVYLCRNILQPVRVEFGRYTPNSVYRCQRAKPATSRFQGCRTWSWRDGWPIISNSIR